MERRFHIVYDGECGFCVRSLKIIGALDVFGRLRFYDSHDPQTYQLFPQLVGANVAEAMYTVVDNEPAHEGFFAFRRLIWSSPIMLLSFPLFYFPGASYFGPKVYAWVARNRSRFGCRTEVCDLPTRSKAIAGD